ncbi:hypothetical protein COW36_20190 [bacterium (Candidatus Blackallbacteria) CG17_big_fil_post_rev_8_21_14_2_50_48_46]|uniref:CDP-glycerol--glycerophosphate glycerophosphotransferase n=1 Tax=bacterium (Candidatus Blackallbacteria) CG17_big_fil_post_rev_8_21_14_2_50_48_46 TaxID=2014261 RepID=A0A2M7FZL6_9BACT|nr:MAG: hypothetical protein COW64_22515 [bacterium (Candidatus Blackallbacteria) CG18_big_fil_WC_8_21_14_2_50_49_26]PIW14728.1 MAG: hypothetical protein COW36_20190 [bacterium (Candidatus Blackallbacteria) CG17_big_fil_post_rev_8_21_14_2_50_48_46]PIW50830.1 MAG: hypothetical protein COW20_01005 [bacterium (Candidatus Blackallbacteria) CG13_big_fil_rev_8_21_14_2_50_49_14]
MSYLQVPKMGFLFHIPEMYFNYRNVLNLLDRDSFDIVLPDEASESLLDIMAAEEYRFSYISELLQSKTLYRYLISDHIFLHDYQLMNQLGSRQIKFSSELGCDRLHLNNWNKLYDMILCFGRYQEKKLKFCERSWIFQVGWPQYDPFFQEWNPDYEALNEHFGCDPHKPTILWLPYFEGLSSIDIYAERMAALTDRYNVLVKPHDYTLLEEYERIQLLDQLPFTSVLKRPMDTLPLLLLADTVFADYGNTPFPPLYCDKRLILLSVPFAPEHEYVGFGSSDITLRSYLPTLKPESRLDEFHALLEDEAPWERFFRKKNMLKERFFASTYGSSAQKCAEILNSLDRYL